MPADDLVLNVRQIGNYPPTGRRVPRRSDCLAARRFGRPLSVDHDAGLRRDRARDRRRAPGRLDRLCAGRRGADADLHRQSGGGARRDAQLELLFLVGDGASPTRRTAWPPPSAMPQEAELCGAAAPPGSPGAPCPITDFMTLSPTGELTLYADSLTLPRDPMLPMEAATAQWVSANTVASFNGRTGAVALGTWDILSAGGAPIWSPQFGGAPCAPTPEPASSSTRIATTAYVQTAINEFLSGFLASEVFVASFNGRHGRRGSDHRRRDCGGERHLRAARQPKFHRLRDLADPAAGDRRRPARDHRLRLNAVADGVRRASSRTMVAPAWSLSDAADVTSGGRRALASPAFTGTPTAPTAAPGTNTTQIATTAFVAGAGVGNFAPLNSPAFTGVPTAPTAAVATNTPQLATTAFVRTQSTRSTPG